MQGEMVPYAELALIIDAELLPVIKALTLTQTGI